MARERLTEEFVRHYRHLVERTTNSPEMVMRALDRHPELAVSIGRLLDIQDRVNAHRMFGKRRYIVQAHPEFAEALRDFVQRWAPAREALRDRAYGEAVRRVADEFLRNYRLLVKRTGDNPDAVANLRKADAELGSSITELEQIASALDDPQYYGEQIANIYREDIPEFNKFVTKIRYLGHFLEHAPSEFPEAFEDYKTRWDRPCRESDPPFTATADDLLSPISFPVENDVQMKPPNRRLEKLVEDLPDMPVEEEMPSVEDPDRWRFDPDRDSIALIIEILEDRCRSNAGRFSDDFDGWAAGGLRWLRETVGINFGELQERWEEIPVIAVPQHVSDKYGLNEPRGLFGLLDQIRLAYIAGADVAAIALCRAITEFLIREYYTTEIPHAKNSRKTGLTWLIEQVQDGQELMFLRNYNLTRKVKEANDILHKPALPDIEHRSRYRGLVRDWLRVLEEMINRAPSQGTAAAAR